MTVVNVSIALCTHNGGHFLPGLLQSLAVQTVQPFELVVCDDASVDETVTILGSFADHAPFPVHIHSNPARLGVVKNFEKAISLCSGQVVALSDQDDIWYPDKLKRLVAKLAAPGFRAAFCDAEVVDSALNPMGYTIWQRVCFTPAEQHAMMDGHPLDVLFKHDVVTGAALAFRAELVPLIKGIPDGWAHDAWIAAISAACGSLTPVAEPLLAYRQHGNNVVGGRKRHLLQETAAALNLDRAEYYLHEIKRWQALYERLSSLPVTPSTRGMAIAKLAHLKRRASLPSSRWRRIPGVMRELFAAGYSRYARNWGSVAMDLLVK